ncbi:MAG: precorrin-4 C11-methyltransferase [Bryobacterales bacterium]|nr:precorrin-4 C11-methyltransferase [Bryobacterales bacterium]
MKVSFVGAGPGAADLITVRGARLLATADTVMYAGSLVPEALLEHCGPHAEIVNTAALNLEQQQAIYERAHADGKEVVRLHSGDPAIYGATAEQMRRLERLGIPYEIVPGVSSFTAAAAAIEAELTRPDVSQTIILTRVSGRASAVPEKEALSRLAAHRATLCIFLSGPHLKNIVADLLEHYDPETPIALVQCATRPEQRVHRGTLARILDEVKVSDWQLTTICLVGEALSRHDGVESRLYAMDYAHRFRKVAREEP